MRTEAEVRALLDKVEKWNERVEAEGGVDAAEETCGPLIAGLKWILGEDEFREMDVNKFCEWQDFSAT